MKLIVDLYHVSALNNWITKLQPYMKDTEFHVFHFSSLQGTSVPLIDNINFYDISYLSYGKLVRIINEINPDKMLFLTFRSVLDYTLSKICYEQGIHRVFLEHGLFSPDTTRYRPYLAKRNPAEAIKRQIYHIYKFMGYAFHHKNTLKSFVDFYDFYRKGNISKMQYDHYYLYSERSFECYNKIFSNVKDNYTLVGYPIFNDEIQKKDSLRFISNPGEGILYVHQPLIFDGVASCTYEEERKYLIEMSKLLTPKYGKFTILLHPRADLLDYKKMFDGTEIQIVQSPNNYKVFAAKKLIVGHYSTALLFGLYFDKPTVIIDYPSVSSNEVFSSIFPSFKTANDLLDASFDNTKDYKVYMIGQGNTYEHIAKELERPVQR